MGMKKTILTITCSAALVTAWALSPGNTDPRATAPHKAKGELVRSLAEQAHYETSNWFEAKIRPANSGFKTAKSGLAPSQFSHSLLPVAAGFPDLRGCLIYYVNMENSEIGLYQVPNDNDSYENRDFYFNSIPANYGAAELDGIYYCNTYSPSSGIATTIGYDIASGAQVYNYTTTETKGFMAPGGMAYDPITGKIMGDFLTDDGSTHELATIEYIPGNAPVKTVIAQYSGTFSDGGFASFAIAPDGKIYVIDYAGDLLSVSRTGAVTRIGATGCEPGYKTDATIDQTTGKMYWTVSPPPGVWGGFLTEVNLQTGKATTIMNYDWEDQYAGLFIPAPRAVDAAPGECTNVSVNFPADALTGTVTLTTPATFYDGTSGSGPLTVIVMAENNEIVNMSANWNTTLNIPVDFTQLGAGLYNFTIYAKVGQNEGPKTRVAAVFVGMDTPKSPAPKFTYSRDGSATVTWDPITESANGGYIDTRNITYTVTRDDGSVALANTPKCSFIEKVPLPDTPTSRYYTVTATSGTMTSAPGKSNPVMLGNYPVPYQVNFDAEGLNGYTVIDSNNDGITWLAMGTSNAAGIAYNPTLPMNDWLITPHIALDKNYSYKISFVTFPRRAETAEKIEVKYGKDPTIEDMTTTLLEPTWVTDKAGQSYEFYVYPDETTGYCIGFHAISDQYTTQLFVRDIKVERGPAIGTPGYTTAFHATPDMGGAMTAEITMKAPALTMNGAPLEELTAIDIYRDGDLIHTFDNPTPGASLSYTDDKASRGLHTWSAIAKNTKGTGLAITSDAFVGFAAPLPPENVYLRRTDNEGEVHVSWRAVTKDIYGKTLPLSGLSYNVYESVDGYRTTKKLGETSRQFVFQSQKPGEQNFVQGLVHASYDKVEGSGFYSALVPVGTPYTRIRESFTNSYTSYPWAVETYGLASIMSSTDGGGVDAYDRDNGYINFRGSQPGTGAALISGLINLKDMANPAISFAVFNPSGESGVAYDTDINEVSVWIRPVGEENFEQIYNGIVKEIGKNKPGWATVSVPLDKFAGKTIQFKLRCLTYNFAYTVIDDIRIASTADHDLVADRINAPEEAARGEQYKIHSYVANDGKNIAENFKVELYTNGELTETKQVNSVSARKSCLVTFDVTMPALATQPIAHYVKVVYDKDENVADNQSREFYVKPTASELLKPESFDAEFDARNATVNLSWSAPALGTDEEQMKAKPVLESFEDGIGFSDTFGDWKFVDIDGDPVGGFAAGPLPGITIAETTGSFWVWDHRQVPWTPSGLAGNTGAKAIFALFTVIDDKCSDDWAISPELSGNAQTIEFYARAYSESFHEAFTIAYSKTGREIEDFITLEGSKVDGVPGAWTHYEFDLPEGAKYFAIHSSSVENFILQIDDVTYEPKPQPALKVEGYNIYRNGEKLNAELVKDTRYADTAIETESNYRYQVSAVYADNRGESDPTDEFAVSTDTSGVEVIGGNTTVIAGKGMITVLRAQGKNVSISAADGTKVAEFRGGARTDVAVSAGIYIVTINNKTYKTIIN